MQSGGASNLFANTFPYFLALLFLDVGLLTYESVKEHRKSHTGINLNNLGQLLSEQLFKGILFKSVLFSGYAFLFRHYHFFEFGPQWYSWLIAFLLIDFIGYVEHWINHKFNVFWAIHEVHHQPELMNLTVTPRNHWLNSFVKIKFFLPLALLGISPPMFFLIMVISAYYTALLHTEEIKSFGLFSKVLVSPDHHRVHHGRNTQYLDKNFGIVLIVWDKIFKTFEPEGEKVEYGITAPRPRKDLLYLNMAGFLDILEISSRQTGLLNKIRLWFWSPQQTRHLIPKKSVQIQNLITSPEVWNYGIFQFIWTSSLSILFFQMQLEWKDWVSWLFCFALFLGFLNQALWNKTMHFSLEIARIIILIFVTQTQAREFIYLVLIPAVPAIIWLSYLKISNKPGLSF